MSRMSFSLSVSGHAPDKATEARLLADIQAALKSLKAKQGTYSGQFGGSHTSAVFDSNATDSEPDDDEAPEP